MAKKLFVMDALIEHLSVFGDVLFAQFWPSTLSVEEFVLAALVILALFSAVR